MLNSMSRIERRRCPSSILRGKCPKFRAFALSAVLALCVCGTYLAAQESSPKPDRQTEKGSQPPRSPAAGSNSAIDQMTKLGIDQIEKQLVRLMKERDSLLEERRMLRIEISGQCGLSPENAKPLMLSLERDRFTLQIALEPKRLHVHILTEMVHNMEKERQKRIDSDRVTEGLKKIVTVRRAIRDRLRTVPVTEPSHYVDFDKAEADLAEAEVRLALRGEEIAKSQGDGEMERLIRQLRELSNELMLDEVRLKELTDRLNRLQHVQELVEKYNAVNESLHAIDAEIGTTKSTLRSMN